MTRRGQWLLLAAIVLVVSGAVGVTMYGVRDEIFPVDVGRPAPPFTAVTLFDHAPRTLADYQAGGRNVVLVNIWATWCVPCRVEMPSLERLHREFAPHGLKVVGINSADEVSDSVIAGFARSYGLTFDILRDLPAAGADSVKNIYKATGFPESFVIDRNGMIRKKWAAADDWASDGNRALIASLLGLPVPGPAPTFGDTALGTPARRDTAAVRPRPTGTGS